MKRLLLPASALVLVLTACGAGAKPAPRVTEVGARTPSVRAIVARREAAAMRDARKLVREFVPPPGAHRDRARQDHGGILHRSGIAPLGESVVALRFWRVREPLATVVAFLRAHDPKGFRLAASTYASRPPHYLLRTLAWPASRYREPTRYLNETVAALPGRTVIRVEAKVGWIYPRSPRETVPSRTSEIAVRSPKGTFDVKSPAKVARIVRWFDALPISPPGIAIACPLILAAHATLSFRSAGGAWLALATVPLAAPANICDPIGFKIGGRPQKALIDSGPGTSFVRRLGRILGVQLVRTRR
jgi:hypothetical protein